MREIKFRAWDKKKKTLDTDGLFLSYLNGGLKVDGCAYPLGNGWVEGNINKELETMKDIEGDVILMQYTGLKDKNGKEIYEGDIIKSGSTYPLEVYWMGLAWGVRWKDGEELEESIICDDLGDMTITEDYQLEYMEIIGNIYENPEPLTPKGE